MLKKTLAVLLAAFITGSLYSQEITFTINGSKAPLARIFRYHGSKMEKVDSLLINNFKYTFKPDSTITAGEYLFSLPGRRDIQFLYTGTSFTVQAKDSTLGASISFGNSKENEVFHTFLKQEKQYDAKKEELEKLARKSSKRGKQQQTYLAELNKAKEEYTIKCLDLAKNNPGLLASTIIKATVGPVPPPALTMDELKKWRQEHFFDNVDLSDPRLEFTEISGKLIWNYLELFFNTTLDKETQEAVFKNALNNLFGRSDIAENLVLFWANDLFNTFGETDYDGLTTYLWDSFIQSHCSQNDDQTITPADIEKIKATAIGQKAFDFTITTSDGNKLTLSQSKAKYTLVLFWASWCPHCIHELPLIKNIYDHYNSKGFGIIGISVDYDKSEYEKFLKDYKVDWPNSLAAQSWQNDICKRYNVTGTPKMVLVDQNLTIISKPTTPEQLEAKLVELLGK